MKSYFRGISVEADPSLQTITLRFPWDDIELLDYANPHLYRLDVTVRGVGFFDSFRQAFGFREYHFDRTEWALNDHPFQLRAITIPVGDYSLVNKYLNAGFSVGLVPRFDLEDPDNILNLTMLLQEADKSGLPLIFEVPSNKIENWDNKAKNLWKILRNHPSFMLFYSQEMIPHLDGFTDPIAQIEMIPMSTPLVAPASSFSEGDVERLAEFAAKYLGI